MCSGDGETGFILSHCAVFYMCSGDGETGFRPVTRSLPWCRVLHSLSLRQVVKLGQASLHCLVSCADCLGVLYHTASLCDRW